MFNKNQPPFFDRRAQRSSALIITLAALVLLSVVILLFFQTATLNRQISYTSAGQYRANVVANTAMSTIEGDFRNEIVAGSTLTTVATSVGTSNLYLPIQTSTVTNLTMVPFRVADQGYTNLITQSASTSNFWTAANYNNAGPVRSAAGNSTVTASLNGHYISINQWNKPGLLGDPGSGTTPQLPGNSPATGTAYIPPDWVVVTRQGPITNAISAMPSVALLANKSFTNQNYAVGRYAYTVYDESGLIDANAVGVPQTLEGTTFSSQRGTLSQVDLANLLANLPTPDPNANTDAAALIAWRNAGTIQSPINYTNYALYSTNGFVTAAGVGTPVSVMNHGTFGTSSVPAPGDQAFVSRQDLINYIQNNSTIPPAALQYLGTFTRDSDGPSYFPYPNRRPSPNGLAADNLINPNMLSVRVQSVFTRASDGTQSVIGEPLLKHRFPLSRLALFQNPTGNATLIRKYFAMNQRSDGTWDYWDPDLNQAMSTLPTIKTLAQVAATTSREPDFWELLQAGILTGSLGTVNCWNGATTPISPSATLGYNCTITDQDASTTRHVLAIGLNVIDQYTAAATPPTPFVLNLGGLTPATLVGTTLATQPTTASMVAFSQATSTLSSAPRNILNNLPIISEENVPYIYSLANNIFYDLTTPALNYPTTIYPAPKADNYLQFVMWNPHRNPTSIGAGSFRLVCLGSTFTAGVNNAPGCGIHVLGGSGVSPTINWGTNPNSATAVAFTFPTSTTAAGFNPPVVLGPVAKTTATDNVVGAAPLTKNAQFPSPAFGGLVKEVGLLLGQFQADNQNPPQTPTNGWYFSYTPLTYSQLYSFYGTPGTSSPLTMVLEVNVGGNWVPYQIVPDFQYNDWGTLGQSFNTFSTNYNQPGVVDYFGSQSGAIGGGSPTLSHADPRTMRFGFMVSAYGVPSGGVAGKPVVSGAAGAILLNNYQLVTEKVSALTPLLGSGLGFFPNTRLPTASLSGSAPPILSDFAYNLDPSVFPSAVATSFGIHSYPDPDGVYRKGDNNPTATEIGGASSPQLHVISGKPPDSPYYVSQNAAFSVNDALPIMLNRPFTSVAELGYAYRDVPWRSLDFSSQNSADGGLLDLFCLNQNYNSLRAGVLNLNSASIPVLTAILTGASTDPAYGAAGNPVGMTTTPPLTSGQASSLATGIYTTIHPAAGTGLVLGNSADLPKLVAQIGTNANNRFPATTSTVSYTPKFRRETVSRAFADVTNTRTWNLLIDVVAQSGRYTASSQTLNNFVVEGEKRYWLHVAIDRLTGEIVDSQMESVSK